MFKGIVEAMGLIRDIRDERATRRFQVVAPEIAPELEDGDSVAVDGACLTVTGCDDASFSVDVIGTTLQRTVAGRYVEGSTVNLERALLFGDRIDGHLVQGHIDGIGNLMQCTKEGEYWLMDFRLPADVARLTVARGSVALNGVSLTVAELLDEAVCRVGIIPFTYEHTNLSALQSGDGVNVEGDLIGKYVGRVLEEREPLSRGGSTPRTKGMTT